MITDKLQIEEQMILSDFIGSPAHKVLILFLESLALEETEIVMQKVRSTKDLSEMRFAAGVLEGIEKVITTLEQIPKMKVRDTQKDLDSN